MRRDLEEWRRQGHDLFSLKYMRLERTSNLTLYKYRGGSSLERSFLAREKNGGKISDNGVLRGWESLGLKMAAKKWWCHYLIWDTAGGEACLRRSFNRKICRWRVLRHLSCSSGESKWFEGYLFWGRKWEKYQKSLLGWKKWEGKLLYEIFCFLFIYFLIGCAYFPNCKNFSEI